MFRMVKYTHTRKMLNRRLGFLGSRNLIAWYIVTNISDKLQPQSSGRNFYSKNEGHYLHIRLCEKYHTRIMGPVFVTENVCEYSFTCWHLISLVMKAYIFWNITPCSPLKVNRPFGGTSRDLLVICLMLVFCLAYFSTLRMEMTCSSETSIDFQRTTLHYVPEDRALHLLCCEILYFKNTPHKILLGWQMKLFPLLNNG
jgi:hypothetical protein